METMLWHGWHMTARGTESLVFTHDVAPDRNLMYTGLLSVQIQANTA